MAANRHSLVNQSRLQRRGYPIEHFAKLSQTDGVALAKHHENDQKRRWHFARLWRNWHQIANASRRCSELHIDAQLEIFLRSGGATSFENDARIEEAYRLDIETNALMD